MQPYLAATVSTQPATKEPHSMSDFNSNLIAQIRAGDGQLTERTVRGTARSSS